MGKGSDKSRPDADRPKAQPKVVGGPEADRRRIEDKRDKAKREFEQARVELDRLIKKKRHDPTSVTDEEIRHWTRQVGEVLPRKLDAESSVADLHGGERFDAALIGEGPVIETGIIVLSKYENDILELLNDERFPLIESEIANKLERDPKTIRPHLKRLRQRDYVWYPHGERKGLAISKAGRLHLSEDQTE